MKKQSIIKKQSKISNYFANASYSNASILNTVSEQTSNTSFFPSNILAEVIINQLRSTPTSTNSSDLNLNHNTLPILKNRDEDEITESLHTSLETFNERFPQNHDRLSDYTIFRKRIRATLQSTIACYHTAQRTEPQ